MAAAMSVPPRAPNEFKIAVWRTIFVLTTAALLFAWLTSSDIGKWTIWGFRPEMICSSWGRAGVRCIDRSQAEGQSQRNNGAEKNCISAGRGGLIC
jgi:hypothetical protein